MHGEAPPPFDKEEAGLTTKTTQKMIYTCRYDSLGHPRTVHYSDRHAFSCAVYSIVHFLLQDSISIKPTLHYTGEYGKY